jgi:hypothetical protein
MMMADGSPVRVIGHWGKLSEQERKRALGRGLDKILDSGLSEDVWQRGDAAISAANFTIGCPDSPRCARRLPRPPPPRSTNSSTTG